MAKDFLSSQIRTNQIIASRSLGSRPSLIFTSASAADGAGGLSPLPPSDPNVFVFFSGSRSTDAFVAFGGSIKTSGSLTVNDNATFGASVSEFVVFNSRISSNFNPTNTDSNSVGIASNRWNQVFGKTGSFAYLSSSDNAIFYGGLTGSLQRTVGGLSYLLAGTGITISTASSGQITVASVGVAGGIDKQVQFNDSGLLAGDDGLTYNKTTKTLSVGNLYVTGAVTVLTATNLAISDPVIYIASGSVGPNVKSVIAFASGSNVSDKSLIFGSIGANNILAAARLDVQAGNISQSSLTFNDLVPIRAAKFEIGGTSAALTSSDGQQVTLYSGGGSSISIVPGSTGLKIGNSSATIALSGSDIKIGNVSSEFGNEIPPHPGVDSYFFVSGSIGSKDTSTRGTAVFGGDLVISGTLHGGSPLKVSGSIGLSGSLRLQKQDSPPTVGSNEAILYVLDDAGTKKLYWKNSDNVQQEVGTGGGGGGSSYFTDPSAGFLNTTGSLSLAGGLGSSHTTSNVGSDVFLFVSGTRNDNTSTAKKSVFGGDIRASGSLAQGLAVSATGNYSHAEGWSNTASGNYSHAEGVSTVSSGFYSHAEGNDTNATGEGSHAEGDRTTASGTYTHAEGLLSIAAGDYSHAEGSQTTSAASYSHAAGLLTIASGSYSYVGGQGTISSGSYQHVIGRYNKRGDSASLFIVGNGLGDSDANRSDVFSIRSGTLGNGEVEIAGSLTLANNLYASGSVYLGNNPSNIVYFNASLGTNMIPDSDMSRNLGSSTKRFANVYTGDLHLRNDRGDYTLIEEEDCLTIRFNKTGKRYKFLLEPAPEYDDQDI